MCANRLTASAGGTGIARSDASVRSSAQRAWRIRLSSISLMASMEVTGAITDLLRLAHPQLTETPADHVHHVVLALEPPLDHEERREADHLSIALVQVRGNDDVEVTE